MLRVVGDARRIDSHMISEVEIPGIVLMENAAAAVVQQIEKSQCSRILVLCGTGNNGGDGFAILRKLRVLGIFAKCILVGNTEKIVGDAKIAYDSAKHICDITCTTKSHEVQEIITENSFDCVVDCMFGTGLCREITCENARIIELANAMNVYKLAVDIPSGVCASTGKILGTAFFADETVTFQHMKRGMLLYPGREAVGTITIAKIGETLDSFDFCDNEFVLCEDDAAKLCKNRKKNSHKGNYGKVLFIAGSEKFSGAAVLSLTAATRCGVGLVRVFCNTKTAYAINEKVPEAMTYTFDGDWKNADMSMLDECIAWADCVSVGTGVGADIPEILERVLATKKPVVIDADGINTLARHDNLRSMLHDKVALTPHFGEMARLANVDIDTVSENQRELAIDMAKKLGVGAINLKGATSVIASRSGKVAYNITGNSGLAKGGSGDVLAGFCAALISQGNDVWLSLCTAAYLLGIGAEGFVKMLSEGCMLPHDIAMMYTDV